MTKKQMVEEILKAYDADRVKRYGKWLQRQPKETVAEIFRAVNEQGGKRK